MEKRYRIAASAFLIICLASLLGIALSIINSSLMPLSILEYAFIAFPVVILSFALFSRLRDAYAKRRIEEEVVEGLYTILYYGRDGIPIIRVIERAAASSRSKEAKKILGRIARKIRLGESLDSAISSIGAEYGIKVLEEIRDTGKGSTYKAMMKAIDSYELRLEEKRVMVDESIQRYATVNMFVSTVLPSFVIFSFLGEMVLSQNAASLSLFSGVLVALMPLLYLIGNSVLSGRLLG